MPLFEVQGSGFDASSDETDDRILWVEAPNAEIVRRTIADADAKFCGLVDLRAEWVAPDFTLPRQALNLQSVLLEFVGVERNKNRPV